MEFTVETERETDGRWIAEVLEIPGVMKYGKTREEAVAHAEALALRVLAERIEEGEQITAPIKHYLCRMSQGPSTKAKRVLSALLRNGWEVKRSSGPHRTLTEAGYPVLALYGFQTDRRGRRSVAL